MKRSTEKRLEIRVFRWLLDIGAGRFKLLKGCGRGGK
jgi:hypothetical protein